MKRLAFILFLLAAVAAMAACGGGAPVQAGGSPPGWEAKDMVIPYPTDDPRVEDGLDMIQSKNMTAEATRLTPAPPTPTLAPPPTATPGPLTHKVVAGETPIHVMGYVSGPMNGNCNWADTMLINGISNPNLILIDQVIVYPSDCHWVDEPVP